MKIHILSDVHLEFGKWPRDVDVNAIDADVTVLAGDIGIGLQGIEWALTIDRPVIYVFGNHEYYGERPMTKLWAKAREKVADTHVHLLDNDTALIDDPQTGERVRFLAATLWTDFCIFGADQLDAMMGFAQDTMSDYSSIFVTRRGHRQIEFGSTARAGDQLTARKTLAMHHESRDFLEQELQRNPDPRGMLEQAPWSKTVVVTHHAPSARSLTYEQPASRSDAAYASNLESLASQVDLWVHGHTHVCADYRVGAGRVVSNSRGYAGRGAVHDFNPQLVIEV